MLYPELYKDLLKVLQPSPTSTPLPPLLPTTSPFFSPFISHLLLLSDGGKAAGRGGGNLCLPLEAEGGRASADCKQRWFLKVTGLLCTRGLRSWRSPDTALPEAGAFLSMCGGFLLLFLFCFILCTPRVVCLLGKLSTTELHSLIAWNWLSRPGRPGTNRYPPATAS